MAAKGSTVGRINGIGATHAPLGEIARGAASEFDRSMNKAKYVDDTPVPVIVMDCEHSIEYLNPAAALMLGVEQGACIGLKLWDIIDVEACRSGSCTASHAMRDGHATKGEADGVVKGRRMHIRSYATPRYDDRNRLIGTIEVILETTGKQADIAALTEFGKGNFDFEPEMADGRKAVIDPSIERLRTNVKTFIEEMKLMSEARKAGENDTFLPEEKFEGTYRVMAKGVNDMAKGQMSVIDETMACVSEFGKGNFEAELRKFPGKFASINETIEQVRSSLKAVIVDVDMLAEAASEQGRLDVRADTAKHQGDFKKIIEGLNKGFETIGRPFSMCIEHLERLSRGINGKQIPNESKGDLLRLRDALNKVFSSIDGLINDSAMLAAAGAEGKLDTRADASKHEGDFRKIVQGVNDTLDAVIRPLNVAAGYVDRISKGDIPEKITDIYNGDFNAIKNNLNQCIDGLGALREATTVTQRMSANDYTQEVSGNYLGIFADLAAGINGAQSRVRNAIETLYRIAQGNIEDLEYLKKVGRRSEGDKLIPAMVMIMDSLQALVTDAEMLTKAAVEGKLETRADAGKHKGEFGKVVHGINDTLDAVIGPLTFSAGYVDRISKGDIPEKITANYNGDFNTIKLNLNQCIDAVNSLVADAAMLTKAAVEGKLETRADASKHQGDYRKIVQGVNDTLDAVIGPLTFSAGYVDRISKGDIPEKITANYNGDFNLIKLNLNQCIDAVNSLVADAASLTRAAVDGKLETRADASKHQGDYRKIVQGVNDTLDAVIGPLTFSAGYVDRISKGDIPEKITANYNGDFNLIKLNLNQCIDAVNFLVADAAMLTKAAVEGKLETRADASKHQGDYRKIVQGVNDTLDAVVRPIQDVSAVLTKLAGGDFTTQVSNRYAGDYELLVEAVNTLSKSVRAALAQIGGNVAALASSAEELNKVSQSMGANADETATQASVVSAASEQVSANVQTVATGADEMGTSIKEIAKNTAEATRVASSAVRTAEVTNETIAKLGQSSAEVGQVIKVITSIAQQTNLLALNATIEAARAGEAGKGFAVVANEVKELAKETAKATEDISRKIEAIQGDTNGAVSAISQISQVIGQISGIQTTIASAIEEQSATTNEIGRNLAEIAKGSTDISRNIGGVADAARATTVGATDTSKAAHSLERMAAELQTLVGQFRY